MKLIKGSTRYYIDSDGNIYLDGTKRIPIWLQTSKARMKAGILPRYTCNIDGKRRIYHRVVAENLVDGWFDGAVVDHIDRDTSNNHPSNLRWVTASDNRRNCDEASRIAKNKAAWDKKDSRTAHAERRNKPVSTPNGVFPTRKDAEIAYGTTLWYKFKRYPTEYFYVL